MKTKRRHFLQRVSVGQILYAIALVVGLVTLLVGPRRVTAQAALQDSKSAKASEGDVERGRRLFINDGCYECHGTEAQGGGYTGPRLAPLALPLDLVVSQVRRPAGEMPPFTSEVLSDRELLDIYAFLQSVPDPPAINTIPILRSSK